MPNLQGVEALRVTVKTPKGDRMFFPVMDVGVGAASYILTISVSDDHGKVKQEFFGSGQWSGFTVEP